MGGIGGGQDLAQQVIVLALHQQRLAQLRMDLAGRGAQRHRAAQLLLGGDRVALFEIDFAQQDAGGAVLRILLHRVLELDDGRVEFVLRAVLAGVGDQRVGVARASGDAEAKAERHGKHHRGQAKPEGLLLLGHGILLAGPVMDEHH